MVLRDGFLLEEAGLQCLKSSGSLHGSTKSLTLSAKAFSMPLASVLTANPLAVEGLFSHLLNLLKSEQGLVCQEPQTTRLIFTDDDADDELVSSLVDSDQLTLKKVEYGHQEKKRELCDMFIDPIQKSFDM